MSSLCHTVLFNKQRWCHHLICWFHSLFCSYCLVLCVKKAPKMPLSAPNCICEAQNGPPQTRSCTPGFSQCPTSPHSGPNCSHQALIHPTGPQFASPAVPVAQDRPCSVIRYISWVPWPTDPCTLPWATLCGSQPPPRPLEILGFREIYFWDRQVLRPNPWSDVLPSPLFRSPPGVGHKEESSSSSTVPELSRGDPLKSCVPPEPSVSPCHLLLPQDTMRFYYIFITPHWSHYWTKWQHLRMDMI